ncbi:MAG TPA: hypothetical protein VIG38_13845 [Hyphomicrobium sp.]
MNLGRALALVVTAIVPTLGGSAVLAQGPVTAPAAVQELAGEHPAEYYKRASELFKEGKKDDAVFIFYLGQLRFRTHLLAKPGGDPTGDPTIFASLSEVSASRSISTPSATFQTWRARSTPS